MRKLIVSEFVSLDGVMQAPGGKDEDRDGGFEHGGWTVPFWHDDIGGAFGGLMQGVDAFLLGRRTYVTHAEAFEPLPPGDPFGDLMNAPKKYVVSKTLTQPIWRNTTVIRDNVIESIRAHQGGAWRHHPDRRQQPARARHDRARPGRRAAPARVSADTRQWQTRAAGWCAHDLRVDVGHAVSDRGRGAALPAPPVSARRAEAGGGSVLTSGDPRRRMRSSPWKRIRPVPTDASSWKSSRRSA